MITVKQRLQTQCFEAKTRTSERRFEPPSPTPIRQIHFYPGNPALPLQHLFHREDAAELPLQLYFSPCVSTPRAARRRLTLTEKARRYTYQHLNVVVVRYLKY